MKYLLVVVFIFFSGISYSEEIPSDNYVEGEPLVPFVIRELFPEGFSWVSVLNEEMKYHVNREFVKGDVCIVDEGGMLKIIEIRGDLLLVEFWTRRPRAGTECPSGILFEISSKNFISFKE